jgi:hypothetical protein
MVSAAMLLAAGCGHQTYEQRLDESKRYFAYVKKLDDNLSPPIKEGSIEELRPPIQFGKPIPRPAPVKDENGNLVEPEVDPRQPSYLAIELPGLIAAFQAQFEVTTSEGREKRPGYLYALSNAVLLAQGKNEESADFTKTVLSRLAEGLRVPQLDLTDFVPEEYPRSKTYTQPNKFEVYRFKPDQITIDNIHYSVEVYCQRAGEVQFCLVVVLPEGLDSQTKLAERVPLMLERLRISSKRQAASSAAPTAGSGAAPKSAAPPVSF